MIDLREATLREEAGGGGFASRIAGVLGGFTIAPWFAVLMLSGLALVLLLPYRPRLALALAGLSLLASPVAAWAQC